MNTGPEHDLITQPLFAPNQQAFAAKWFAVPSRQPGSAFVSPLEADIALMRESGFRVEVLWRRDAFAILRAAR